VPRFDITDDSVAVILPAHPRHARMRDLAAIERDISLGRLSEATTALEGLLAEDPHNFRTIQLLTQLARSTADASAVIAFAEHHRSTLRALPVPAQIALAEALLTAPRADDAGHHTELARELLQHVGPARIEREDLKRLVISQLTLGDEGGALAALDRYRERHPEAAQDPVLLQLRGRTLLQHAKRCWSTLHHGARITPQLRANARRDLVQYLDQSERELNAALEHRGHWMTQHLAADDLQSLRELRRKASRSSAR